MRGEHAASWRPSSLGRTVSWPTKSLVLSFSLLAAVLGSLQPSMAEAPDRPAGDFVYVEMPDGVKLAIAVLYPEGYDKVNPRANPNVDYPKGRDKAKPRANPSVFEDAGWPTLLAMDGYGASSDISNFAGAFDNRYVVVIASLRGTGCSEGNFDFLSRADAEDGKTVIDEWMPDQPWFNGDVGIVGESYWAITGSLVASTQPRELDVVAIANMIDDLYRGAAYRGGIPNHDLPNAFLAGLRPAFEALFLTTGERLGEEASAFAASPSLTDPTCARHITQRQPQPDPYVHMLTVSEDDDWYRRRSPITYAHLIDKPIHLVQHWQDEVTGPRGSNTLWERLQETVPKRIVLSNGIHSNYTDYADDLRWLDCWTYGDGEADNRWCAGDILDPSSRVRLHFEQQGSAWSPTNPPYLSEDWPLPETVWTRYHLRGNGTLSLEAAEPSEKSRTYLSTSADRHTTEGSSNGIGQITFAGGLPDELSYKLIFDSPTALAGPIHLTLEASSTRRDTDFFIDVLDVGPGGEVSYLQRGLLRASHREVDDFLSDLVPTGPEAGAYYRAYHPHTDTTRNPLTAGVPEKIEVELYPLAHMFREGHSLVIKLHAPAPKDPVSAFYTTVPAAPPAMNTVYHRPTVGQGPRNQPSSILLPVMAILPPISTEVPGCGDLRGIPCFRPML